MSAVTITPTQSTIATALTSHSGPPPCLAWFLDWLEEAVEEAEEEVAEEAAEQVVEQVEEEDNLSHCSQ